MAFYSGSTKLEMPDTLEGKLALANFLWAPLGGTAPTEVINDIEAGNTDQLAEALDEKNEHLARVESRVERSQGQQNEDLAAEYEDWKSSYELQIEYIQDFGLTEWFAEDQEFVETNNLTSLVALGSQVAGADVTGEVEEDTTAADLQAAKDQANAYLLDLYNSGLIAYDEYLLYTDSVNAWEAGEEVNFETVLANFETLKAETIDPYYEAQIAMATQQVQSSKDYQEAAQALEVNANDLTAQQNLATARASLEATGMTFTGAGVEQLGAESAIGTAGLAQETEAAPGFEGLVPAEARLISESTELRYQEALESLAEQSEQLLGTAATEALGLPTVGGFEGTIAEEQAAAERVRLSGLYQQEGGNIAQAQTLNLLSS